MTRSRPLAALVLLLFVSPLAVSSADAAADPVRRPITAQDLWAVKRVGAPALAPDGRRAVVPVQEWSVEKNRPTSRLWLVDVASGTVHTLTGASALEVMWVAFSQTAAPVSAEPRSYCSPRPA